MEELNDARQILFALSELVRLRRIKLDLSQEELAKRAGLGKNYIYEIEAQKKGSISLERLIKLANALEYKLSDVFRFCEMYHGEH